MGFWSAVGTGVGAYIGVALFALAVVFGLYTRSAMAEAFRFTWCTLAHKPWHIVQKEADTLTRMYCTKCGRVHLKLKRKEDYGKPTRL